jgi:hypothetical protein
MTRRHLTDTERREMLIRQLGLCCVPGCMSEGPFEEEHSTPHVWDDKKPDQLMCAPCHAVKTKRDIKAIAKAKRIAEGRTQFDKRAAAGGSRIRGRGFDKSLSKKMNGEVIRNG